jgi:uncharacterized LabA/DUF88 family protein
VATSNRLRIVIDGGYLFNVFKPFREQGYRYSPKRLARLLAQNYNLTGPGVHYVDSINERNPVVKAKQEQFFNGVLRDTLGWEVDILPLQWPGGEPRQKGTDSTLTLLIYKLAVTNACDTLILLAADADFCQPVQEAVAHGIVVRNAYFAIRPSYHLQQACNGLAIRLDDLNFLYHVNDTRTLVTPRSVVASVQAAAQEATAEPPDSN